MKQVLISIIIPVYNVESKIDYLLDSLYKIKNKNIEIIFVNNNSTDNSLEIINKYSLKDKRVKVYEEKKKGPNYARYLGFTKSNGKYIYFIDSDDYIEVNTFNKVIDVLNKNDYDILIGNYNELDSNHNFIKIMHGFGSKSILLYKPCLWNKIFKKSLINKDSFIFTTIGEDMYLTLPILTSTNNIKYINKPIYNYVKNNEGISSKNNYNLLHEGLNSLKLLKNKLCDNNYDEINYVLITHSLYRAFKGILLDKKDRNKIREEILSFIAEIDYKNNKYYKESNIYKFVMFIVKNKFLYNFFLTRLSVYLLFNNKLFNKILKKIDK